MAMKVQNKLNLTVCEKFNIRPTLLKRAICHTFVLKSVKIDMLPILPPLLI